MFPSFWINENYFVSFSCSVYFKVYLQGLNGGLNLFILKSVWSSFKSSLIWYSYIVVYIPANIYYNNLHIKYHKYLSLIFIFVNFQYHCPCAFKFNLIKIFFIDSNWVSLEICSEIICYRKLIVKSSRIKDVFLKL